MIAFQDKHDGYYQFEWDGVSALPEWSTGMTQIAVIVPTVVPPTYADLRAAAYPSIGDQIDALWKGGAAEAAMRDTVLAVKAKYPKP